MSGGQPEKPAARAGTHAGAAAVEAAAVAWARAVAAAKDLGLLELLKGRFWLTSGLMLAAVGTLPWLWELCRSYPWLVLWGLAAACLVVHVGTLVEQYGLVALLPKGALKICCRPLFELLRLLVAKVTLYACNILRIGMLVCVELTEDQSKEILEGLDPSLRKDVFQRPLVQLLPVPIQRLLLGRQWNNLRPSAYTHLQAAERAPPPMQTRHVPSQPSDTPSPSPTTDDGEVHVEAQGIVTPHRASDMMRKSSADSLLEVVRGMDGVVQNTRAKGTVSTLEKILSQKVAGSAVSAARAAMSSAKASAAGTLEYGKNKVSELGEGVKEVVVDRKAQATAASAVGGAVTLGAGGGATGLISGGLLGAAAGLVPAVFTFGLSIPVGAAIGGGTGLCLGTTVGGTAGFFGGGAAGYTLYRRRGSQQQDASGLPREVSTASSVSED